MKSKVSKDHYKKVKSLIDKNEYFYSDKLPSKIIDGVLFVGVKRTESDDRIYYMNKEFLEFV